MSPAEETAAVRMISRALDAEADEAWQRMDDCPRDHPDRARLRDAAFQAKDIADDYHHAHLILCRYCGHNMTLPADRAQRRHEVCTKHRKGL